MKTRIHVNRQSLRNNPQRKPVFMVWDPVNGTREGKHVRIHGPSCLVYRPDKPWNSAVAWIETEAKVTVR